MNASGASQVSSDILEALAKLGGAVIGLSVFAYLAGYFYLSAYYKGIGISWALEMAKAEDLLRYGFVPSGVFGITLSGGLYLLLGNKLKPMIAIFVFIALLIAPLLYSLSSEVGAKPSVAVAMYIGMLIYAAAGLILSVSIMRLWKDKTLSNLKVTGVVVSVLIGTYIAPTYNGLSLTNQLRGSPESFLPMVTGKDGRNDWLLAGYVSEKLILVRKLGTRESEAILVEPGEDWKIGASPEVPVKK
ncbi:TPA: hypothetical protein ACNIHU_004708 [Pseudomonas aeruginosa]|nr:hypothetical protein [Pseudomonas aeruginosa]MCT5591828.1 hypothetical protein [Pseudomonas aeruginosa]